MKKTLAAVVVIGLSALLSVAAIAEEPRVYSFEELEAFIAIHGGKLEYVNELPKRCRSWVRKYTVGDKAAFLSAGLTKFSAEGIHVPEFDTRNAKKGDVIYAVMHMAYQEYKPETVREFMAMGMYPIRKDGAELIENGTAIRLKDLPIGWAVVSGYTVTTDDGKVYPAYHIVDSIHMGAVIRKQSGKIPTDGGTPTPTPNPQPTPAPTPTPTPTPTPNPQPSPQPLPEPDDPFPNTPLLPDPQPQPQDGGGGGCQAGAYSWLLLAVPALLSRRK